MKRLVVVALLALGTVAIAQQIPTPVPNQGGPTLVPPAPGRQLPPGFRPPGMNPIQIVPSAPGAPSPAPGAAAAPVGSTAPGHPLIQAILFWILAAMAVGSSLLTITRRNLVSAVMFLVGTFVSISALFAMLYAHFLAVIQVLVYAGAIMVLFVFVVMILNKEEEEPWAYKGLVWKGLAIAGLVYFVARMIHALWQAPKAIAEPGPLAPDYGTTASMGHVLFSSYLFPFEAVSIVLLIAVVGAIVLAHPGHANVAEEEGVEADAHPDTTAAIANDKKVA